MRTLPFILRPSVRLFCDSGLLSLEAHLVLLSQTLPPRTPRLRQLRPQLVHDLRPLIHRRVREIPLRCRVSEQPRENKTHSLVGETHLHAVLHRLAEEHERSARLADLQGLVLRRRLPLFDDDLDLLRGLLLRRRTLLGLVVRGLLCVGGRVSARGWWARRARPAQQGAAAGWRGLVGWRSAPSAKLSLEDDLRSRFARPSLILARSRRPAWPPPP